jgi:three-Cys-motif partner protein
MGGRTMMFQSGLKSPHLMQWSANDCFVPLKSHFIEDLKNCDLRGKVSMPDALPTVWDAEPHTLAKHAILERYLRAWFPILTQQAARFQSQREILYIDGFAGPGEYAGGQPGSPIIALKAVLNHSVSFPVPVHMLFVEQRQDRFEHLRSVLGPYIAQAQKSRQIRAVEPFLGECDAVLSKLLADREAQGVTFGPALAFFDQFGYSAVAMELIGRVLRYGQCEVFTYLDYKDMNRWITDPDKAQAFNRAYGCQDWRQCVNLPEAKRRTCLLEQYKAALMRRTQDGGAEAKHVTSFLMFDKNEQPLYWLVFCTNNLRGLEEMKKAMWTIDKTGSFRFSDRDNPSQLRLLDDSFNPDWLAEEIEAKFASREMSALAIKEFVLTDTPCYLFKAALKKLEVGPKKSARVIQAPHGRKPGTYPDDKLPQIVLRFGT